MNKATILLQIENSRNKYKPEVIKTILVAEAPPDSIDRFFYFENVKTADYLFLGIVAVLYPEAKAKYLANKRHPLIKEFILKQFQLDGYFLLDLYEFPVSINEDNQREAIAKLANKIEKISDEMTPVVLIKASVYDIAYSSLKLKFNVINERIDFPSCGNQLKFHSKFSQVIKKIE